MTTPPQNQPEQCPNCPHKLRAHTKGKCRVAFCKCTGTTPACSGCIGKTVSHTCGKQPDADAIPATIKAKVTKVIEAEPLYEQESMEELDIHKLLYKVMSDYYLPNDGSDATIEEKELEYLDFNVLQPLAQKIQALAANHRQRETIHSNASIPGNNVLEASASQSHEQWETVEADDFMARFEHELDLCIEKLDKPFDGRSGGNSPAALKRNMVRFTRYHVKALIAQAAAQQRERDDSLFQQVRFKLQEEEGLSDELDEAMNAAWYKFRKEEQS